MSQFQSNVNDYLEGLPESVLARLYQAPATCLAIFRLLPKLSKIFIMNILFIDVPISTNILDILVLTKSKRLKIEAINKLKGLHLFKIKNKLIKLNEIFKKNFQIALTNGPENKSFGIPCTTEDKHKVDIKFLNKYGKQKWETILHFMVGTNLGDSPNNGVLSLLRYSGLMEGEVLQNMHITNLGFQFLLQDINSQIWTLLIQYLNMAEKLNMDPVDVLHFIFMLGSLELGQDYSLSALSDTQIKMLEDLRDYGIVYQRKLTSRRFYPTFLAAMLTADPGSSIPASNLISNALNNDIQEEEEDNNNNNNNNNNSNNNNNNNSNNSNNNNTSSKGFIIIETNFKIYAYTSSPLQIAILNLFTNLKTRLPNLVTGQITRESIRFALANGITADQIITYLTVHAHPQMTKNIPILPPTISDQIRLWQLEVERMTAMPGFLYTDFTNFNDYQVMVTYAQEIGVLLWKSDSKRKFFVIADADSQIREFAIRRAKASKE